ncbi:MULTISPECIES: RagB/SusD family nutrient uptake outer membrane protein [Sphingobacterium]|uniref:RagB/SusD family nutrient uptake outer membrane protein n=2 Tax=Sphingobacterium TaxID=28453 RepID=A0ABR7YTM8_9SPHI|nr:MULTISPECIES: RagB/SusD family nutrient uptake outer membrane protein [Sphingobacterium]MBD1424693.1 RagB/SusD family nutrient uptake outer membrane protein [Sphingobacterium arenae]MBD1434699.1 RagB/SusD family nutrient uptake outer membrane protein [Sphingobacterium micropteri]
MKVWYSFLIITVLLISSSCQKWLELKPENQQVTDDYWANKEEAEAVLGAAYVGLQKAVKDMLIFGDGRGNTLSVAGLVVDMDLIRLKGLSILPSNKLVKWSNFYQIINYANMVLKYAPDVVDRDPSFNQAVMQSYLSEAYFLRALSYFYIVRTFGEAPLLLEPYMDDHAAYEVAKSSKEQIMLQIEHDLTTALANSKEIWPTVWETKGRATKWAIHATLADVYLWMGEYDKAIISCNAVMESGRVGLIQGRINTTNNWFTIFSEGNTNEGIFEIQFDNSKAQNNDLMNMFGASYNWIISNYALSLYAEDTEDIRALGASYATDLKIWKYLGAEAGTGVPRSFSDQNWIVYRMADIYLMKAEALIMKGESSYPAAIELITDVRTRATISRPLDAGTTELQLLDALLKERAKEFLAEGKRWFDLLRVAQRDNYKYKEYFIEQVLAGNPGAAAPVIRAQLMNENAHYLPIHIDELRFNRLLVQNPYYEHLN